MARRGGLQSSLFPFMSVLACTIGSLVVLLAVMALASVGATLPAERALEQTGGHRTQCAALLGISRKVLWENAAKLYKVAPPVQ